MGSVIVVIALFIIAAIMWNIWNKNKKQKNNDMLEKLDKLVKIEGRSIGELESVLGKPHTMKSIDNGLVEWTWLIGKNSIIATWNKMETNEPIVKLFRI